MPMTPGTPRTLDQSLLEALLDSWDRNNIILVNLLRTLGQIKLTLKATGRPISDTEAGPVTWGVWMRKNAT